MVNNQRGFSHIEVLMSLTIFLLVVSFVLTLQGKLFTYSHHNDLREELVLETGNIIEELKSGVPIENIDSKFVFSYQILEETEVYTYFQIVLEHPKVDRFDMTTEHYLLKQEVKSYAPPLE